MVAPCTLSVEGVEYKRIHYRLIGYLINTDEHYSSVR